MKQNNVFSFLLTLLTAGLFQLFIFLHIGQDNFERTAYIFVTWFFVFIILLAIPSYVRNKISDKTSANLVYFSFLLMLDGVLAFVAALFAAWIQPILHPNIINSGGDIAYFSVYYIVFVTIVKLFAKQKYLAKLSLVLVILAIASYFVLADIGIIVSGLCLTLLIAIFLYYMLSKFINQGSK